MGLPAYRKQHSGYYVTLAEWVLRQIVPQSTAAASQRKGFWDGTNQSFEAPPELPGIRWSGVDDYKNFKRTENYAAMTVDRLRRTANVRKLRAFRALLAHDAFRSLAESDQGTAGKILKDRLDGMFAEDCKLRLDEDWETKYSKLRDMTFYVPRRAGKVPWRALAHGQTALLEEASRLLKRLEEFEGDESNSYNKLRTALTGYIKDHSQKGIASDTAISAAQNSAESALNADRHTSGDVATQS